jgi:hypothetical protein
MGIESFRVELQGGHFSLQEMTERIRHFNNILRDPQAAFYPGQFCYVARWDKAVIELETRACPVRISCRMTVCHPIDAVESFLDFIICLMKTFRMELRICDDHPKMADEPFSMDSVDVFSSVIIERITSARERWKRIFGNAEGRYTEQEAHRYIIGPVTNPVPPRSPVAISP